MPFSQDKKLCLGQPANYAQWGSQQGEGMWLWLLALLTDLEFVKKLYTGKFFQVKILPETAKLQKMPNYVKTAKNGNLTLGLHGFIYPG